jgi:predicted amidohydrolase
MPILRIEGVQLSISDHLADNEERILNCIEQVDADIVVFPEMALTGYHADFAVKAAERAFEKIAAACRLTYTTAIVGTGCVVEEVPHIQIRIFGSDGTLVGTQEKLIPTAADREFCQPGDELKVFDHKSLRFGCLSGNDFWVAPGFGPYPDRRLTNQLGERGAQVIFHCNHSGIDPRYAAYYESNLQLRARESGCTVVTVNAAAEHGDVNAVSGVISPEGTRVVSAPASGEQTFSYDLEL